MSQNGYELLAELRAQTLDMFDVPNDLLPAEYHGKAGFRKLSDVDRQYEKTRKPKKDPRTISAKFGKVEGKTGLHIVAATPERAAMLEHYRKQAEAGGEEIELFAGVVDDARLYRAELVLAATLIRAGVMEPFDDDLGFDQE